MDFETDFMRPNNRLGIGKPFPFPGVFHCFMNTRAAERYVRFTFYYDTPEMETGLFIANFGQTN